LDLVFPLPPPPGAAPFPYPALFRSALALAVAGLALGAASVCVTPPASQVRMWMLLVWRTPPRSDLFDAPARRRLMVVALLPNASRKAYGNSFRSNGFSASSEMACSISTAFMA